MAFGSSAVPSEFRFAAKVTPGAGAARSGMRFVTVMVNQAFVSPGGGVW